MKQGTLDDLYRPDEMVLPPTWYQEMEGTVPLRVRLRRDPAHSPGHWSSLTSRDEQGWEAYKARYWGLATLVDRHAGRILDHLDRLDLARDTIVVFSSDHGDMMGEHRLLNKGLPYDGSARVPLLIRVPDLEPRRLDTPVSQVAIVPTLMELLGQPALGHVQEASLVPLLVRGDVDPDRGEAVLEWTGYDGFPASYKEPAVPGFTDEDSARLHRVAYRTIRRGRWKLTVHESGEHELYDLEADPDEAHNAFHDAGARPTVEHLGPRLRSWQERTADLLALPAL
jgi:arylsulfatase A-like enzyme